MVTTWDKMVSGKELSTIKSSRRKVVLTQKINLSELPKYVDQGWEKYKDYKNPKFIGILKEKSAHEC